MQDPKKVAKSPSGHHPTTLSGYIFAIIWHISTIGKNWLSSNISPTCSHNMVNFGPLAAEILSLVWGTTGNFNGFRVLAALLHGTLVVGVSQTAALNRGRHLYSAGLPSRWALAHISSLNVFCVCWQSNIQCLNEKTQFLGFLFRRVVRNHEIGEVGKQSIVWFLTFIVTLLPKIIVIGSCMSRL